MSHDSEDRTKHSVPAGSFLLESVTGPQVRRQDVRLVESAVRKGWEIPDALRDTLARAMATIVATGSNRDKTAAARVLVAMDQANQAARPATVSYTHAHAHVMLPLQEDALARRKRELAARIAGRG